MLAHSTEIEPSNVCQHFLLLLTIDLATVTAAPRHKREGSQYRKAEAPAWVSYTAGEGLAGPSRNLIALWSQAKLDGCNGCDNVAWQQS